MEQEVATQLLAQMAELQTAFEKSSSLWSDLGPPIITGIVGFFAALIPSVLLERRREKRQARTLRASLIAEISGMAEIIRDRGYIEALREGAEGRINTMSVNVPGDYFIIYKSNTASLGLLEPEEASRIVHLYHLIESVVQDVIPGGILYAGVGGQHGFQQDVDFLERALVLADELISGHKTKR